LALSEADFWIVEDTRISAKLAFHLGIKKTMRVANDHSEDFQLEKLLEEIETGKQAVLLTDGGAPGVSDPGARLTDLAHNRGIEVDGIPGPSAVINALMLSGFFAQRFAFLGFLGRTPGDMKKELEVFRDSPYTIVLFESPFRFKNLLKAAGDVLGERRYAICREITKKNQQVFRSELPTIPNETDVPSKGEFTIVIEGRRKKLERQKYVNI
jgi:16S rRNA (cytidine1402-2'-O)-methyltransferase